MDRKRVNGPEASVAPVFKNADKETVAILNSENKRLDDRGVEDVRPICKFFFPTKIQSLTSFIIVLKTGLVTQASGSAYIEVGNTKVTCAV